MVNPNKERKESIIKGQIIASEVIIDEESGKPIRKIHIIAFANKEDYMNILNKSDKNETINLKI